MPDNTRPPRNVIVPDPRPTLGVRAVMIAVEEVARAKALRGARVAYKRNAHNEHVIALIFPAAEDNPPPRSPGDRET